MTLSCSSTDFENDSDFLPILARCCLRFRLCRSIRCVYRSLITCSFPFRREPSVGQAKSECSRFGLTPNTIHAGKYPLRLAVTGILLGGGIIQLDDSTCLQLWNAAGKGDPLQVATWLQVCHDAGLDVRIQINESHTQADITA